MENLNFTIATYNVENLFIEKVLPKYENPHFFKSEDQLENLKLVFNDIEADIYALQEIGFIESLHYFNDKYLENSYEVFHHKGNSSRNIEVAYLVKKELTKYYQFKTISHHKRAIKNPFTKEECFYLINKGLRDDFRLSRNLLELKIHHENKELFTLYNCHLKSARDETGIDFRSKKRRKSELELCLQIIKEQKAKLPIFLGDFNGNASTHQTDDEFKSLYEHNFKDILSYRDLPLEYRSTFFAFSKKRRVPIQLDYVFFKEHDLKHVTDSLIYRYKNEHGRPRPFPKSKYDVMKSPSDHYPLVFTIELPIE